jgi:hypothetical protein
MVLPKMGASYVIKKFADEVMAEPKAIVESTISDVTGAVTGSQAPVTSRQSPATGSPQQETDELDGQPISDESGQTIGTARRLRKVAFYLVSDSYGDLTKELEACLADEESRRYYVHDERGDLAGVIFAPHPDRMPAKAEAIRAEDI